MKVLKKGSRGADVRRVQQALNGCMLPPNNRFTSPPMQRLVEDGAFGPKTEAMVKEYQRLNEITVDGIIGPITSYFIFPYIAFTATLAGQGLIKGQRAVRPEPQFQLTQNRSNLFGSPRVLGAPTVGTPTPTPTPPTPTPNPQPQGGDEKEGLTFELSVGTGAKHAFKPWFVLKPNEEPEGAKSEATLAVGATILRKKGFEFGGELEFSRELFAKGGSSWEWEGSLKGSYTNLKAGRFGISPVVDLSVKQGLNLGLGVGAEGSIELIEDRLELKVGGKFAMDLDPRTATTTGGFELGAGLELKFDVTRLSGKK